MARGRGRGERGERGRGRGAGEPVGRASRVVGGKGVGGYRKSDMY